MTNLVGWAVGVLNPIDGGTAESGGQVYQIVGDIDDLELALEIAENRDRLPPAELEELRDVLQRHCD
ncbi:MAG: hypothetical protein GY811_06855 [Myxococcales bacterium]|nr:hypothetical protein [Myxococcales bacterium]